MVLWDNPPFAARVRRRKEGVNEDSDWGDVDLRWAPLPLTIARKNGKPGPSVRSAQKGVFGNEGGLLLREAALLVTDGRPVEHCALIVFLGTALLISRLMSQRFRTSLSRRLRLSNRTRRPATGATA
jgi:hypothetical protein